ncbi:MAG TPA: hypothetical protein EYP49_10685 [Anaerolineae bacterium]|nr:hypothetical protein [Anaerolineae bacterium]
MDDVRLTAEDLKTFDDFYRRRLAEVGGARDDAEELAVARDILQAAVNDGLTPTADGGASYVRRQGAMDWTDPATIQAAAQVSSGSGRGKALCAAGGCGHVKDMLMGVAMLVGAMAAVAWFLWPRGAKGEGDEAGLMPTPAVTVEAADTSPTSLPTLESEFLADIVDAGVKTGLVVPRTLEIKGSSFVVQPVKITAGDWPLPDDERAVSWVYGTVVNYVLGLEATPANKTLLASLRPGDELLLRMSTGPAYRFAFAGAVRVAPQASEIFGQTRPGLTLALLDDEGQPTRVVIRAVYEPNSEEVRGGWSPAETVEMGRAVTLDDMLRLTPLESKPLALPGAPPGSVHLAVDYVLENRLDGRLSLSGNLAHQVVDIQGLAYPPTLSPLGGTGRYPPLPAQLEAGQTVTATAVYVVLEAVLREGVTWRFGLAPSGTTVQVPLPSYTGFLEPQVTVQEAALLPGGVLALTLDLVAGLRDVTLTAADVQVQGGTLGPDNAFPWQVPAGSSGQFTLSLQPDGGVPLTVVLLEQGFEITVE